MSAERVDVSVLVPVLNEGANVREAAASMQAQRFDGTIEFIFVDGRSQDDTAKIVRELEAADPRIRLIDNPARNTPDGLNAGLRAARGEFVARMDAHTHYPPEYIARGVERLRAGGVEHVSGPQIPHGVGSWSRRVALALSTRLGTGGAGFRHETDAEIEVDSGFTGIWRRSTLEREGGWDEGWPRNQDAELAARIRASGGTLVCLPELSASYIPRDSPRALVRQYWQYGYYRAKTARRHPQSMRRSHVLAPGLALAALAAAGAPERPLRLAARGGLGAYLAVVLAVSAGAARDGRAADAAYLPLVFAAMHLSWGFGFLAGCTSFGPPLAALARVAGIRR